MIKLFGLVMIAVVFLVGAASPTLAQTEWKTFYSPEKKFSIDYVPSESFPLNITETQDDITIQTGPLIIRVGIIDSTFYQQPKMLSMLMEANAVVQGNTVTEATHPITINGKEGYSFTDMYQVEDVNGTIIDNHIFMGPDGRNYVIDLQYDISHTLFANDEIMHTMNSIKFFD